MCNLSWVALYHLKSGSLKKVHLVSQSIVGRALAKQAYPKFYGESFGFTPAMSHYFSLRSCKGPGCLQPYSIEITSHFFFFKIFFPVACAIHCFVNNCVCVGKRPVGFICPSGRACRRVLKWRARFLLCLLVLYNWPLWNATKQKWTKGGWQYRPNAHTGLDSHLGEKVKSC